MKAIQAMVYRPHDLYENDSSPCDINHQKDYTAWTSYMYDKNNFLLSFIDIPGGYCPKVAMLNYFCGPNKF
jgi:hypothetical protein